MHKYFSNKKSNTIFTYLEFNVLTKYEVLKQTISIVKSIRKDPL